MEMMRQLVAGFMNQDPDSIYVHRSGRTARANKEGLSVMLVDSQDALNYRKICKNLNRDQDLTNFPIMYDLISFLTHRVKLASEIESLEHQVSKSTATKNWFKRAAKEADFDDEEDRRRRKNSSDEEDVIDGSLEKRRHIKSMTKRLNALLNQPIPRNSVFTTKYPTAIVDICQHLESEKTSVPSALDAAKKEVERPKEKKLFIKSLKFKDRKMKLKNKSSRGNKKRR
uniref:Uncharacterized protein n=1 Tax=Romanomermis culicivorax TaxID=13658 RepID=A0A915HT01_ROMCU